MTVKDHMTFAVEAQWWKYAGAKEAHVRFLFSESMTRYYQRLGVLLGRADAEAEYPLLVRRLRRLRDARMEVRRADREARRPTG